MRLSRFERVKERDYAVPCKTCGRPTWSFARQCVSCRWFGPPEHHDPLSTHHYLGPFWGRPVEWDPAKGEEVAAPPAVVSELGEVLIDLRCRACGYNLRALHINGNCPQCAAPVAHTLQRDTLAAADPDWLARLRTGSIIATLSFAALSLSLLPALVLLQPWEDASAPVAVCSLVLLLAFALGVLLLTAPDPGRSEESTLSSRRVARWSIVAAIALALGLPLFPLLSLPALLIAAVGLSALFVHVRLLLLRSASPVMAIQASIVAVGLAITLALSLPAAVAALTSGPVALLSCVLVPTLPLFLLWAIVVLSALTIQLSSKGTELPHRPVAYRRYGWQRPEP